MRCRCHLVMQISNFPSHILSSLFDLCRSVANLAQFTGSSTANVISANTGTYAWALWVSSIISLFSVLCSIAVFFLDRYLRTRYDITDYTTGKRHLGATKAGTFSLKSVTQFPVTFWIIVLFTVFENAGVQSFVGISTYVCASHTLYVVFLRKS